MAPLPESSSGLLGTLAPLPSYRQSFVAPKEGTEQTVKWTFSPCRVIYYTLGLPQKETVFGFRYFFLERSKCSLINLLVVIIHP